MTITKKSILTSLTLALLFTACASKNEEVSNHKFNTDITGLKLQSTNPTLVYVRPNAKALSQYKQFMVEPIKVNYNDPSVKKLNKEQIKKLQDYFHNSMTTHLREGGYKVVNKADKETMKMSFILSGIKAPNPAANVISLLAPIAISVGEITVEASFTNTSDNQIKAVVVNKAQGSKVLNTTPWSTWADIESSFDQWAEGITKSISK